MAANASPSDRINMTGTCHLTAVDFFARNGQQNLAQGFSPGLVMRSAGALQVAPTPRTRGAIPTMRNTPVLQNSITPLTRIRGRGRRRGRGRERSASGVAPEGVASTPAYGLFIYPSRPILCPVRAQRIKTLNPGLKPWAKFSCLFRAMPRPMFDARP